MRFQFPNVARLAACAATLAAMLPAVSQAPQKPAPPPPAASDKDGSTEVEMRRLVTELDLLLKHARAAEVSAKSTIAQAQRAQTQASEVEKDRAAWIAHDLRAELDKLAANLGEHLSKLTELRQQAEARAGIEAVDPLAKVRKDILNAQRLPTLSNAEEALKAIEKDLQGEKWKKIAGADQMLGFARFRLAETLLQLAGQQQDLDHGQAARQFVKRACDEYNEVLTGPDAANTGEGSSLHATALWRIIVIEANLYESLRKLSEVNPGSQAVANEMRQHKAAAVKAFDGLRRRFPDATLADGRKVVEAAREDANRVGR